MALPPPDLDRTVVPRWRTISQALATGELRPLAAAATVPERDFFLLRAKDEWLTNRSIATAADFVSAAISRGVPAYAREAAKYLVTSSAHLPEEMGRLVVIALAAEASQVIPASGTLLDSNRPPREQIGHLRQALNRFPRNPLGWLELGRLHLGQGHREAARKTVAAALTLDRTNRHVLRSAARYFLHIDEPDKALHLLGSTPRLLTDPWLLSAHIAVSRVAGKKSKVLQKARRFGASTSLDAFHLSELRSALATEDLHAGDEASSRRLFRSSITNPTENAVAQAVWASRRLSSFQVPDNLPGQVHSFEGQTSESIRSGAWKDALTHCQHWLDDEPFSARPATMGSYLAAVALEDFVAGAQFARDGLRANPHDSLLKNNLAASLASLGDVVEARRVLQSVEHPHQDRGTEIALIATEGLVEFRSGRFADGRALYRKAMELADKYDMSRTEALAALHWAREEIVAGTNEAAEAMVLATTLASKARSDEVVSHFARLTSDLIVRTLAKRRPSNQQPR